MALSKDIDYRKEGEGEEEVSSSSNNITTTTTITYPKYQRLTMIAQLRKLVLDGTDIATITDTLGISKRSYYRLVNKAFEHDLELIEKWDSDQLRIDVAVYRARLEKLYKFYSDIMEDTTQHGLIRLKAAQLASELAPEILRTSEEGVFKVKDRVSSDLQRWNRNFQLRNYLIYRDSATGVIRDFGDDEEVEVEQPKTLARWKELNEIMLSDPEGMAKAEEFGEKAGERFGNGRNGNGGSGKGRGYPNMM